jgi:hypothetical protein
MQNLFIELFRPYIPTYQISSIPINLVNTRVPMVELHLAIHPFLSTFWKSILYLNFYRYSPWKSDIPTHILLFGCSTVLFHCLWLPHWYSKYNHRLEYWRHLQYTITKYLQNWSWSHRRTEAILLICRYPITIKYDTNNGEPIFVRLKKDIK